jgi:hypothetical protein
MDEKKKCKHPACNCETMSDYCSTHCEEAGDMLELACDCGHPGCKEMMAAVEPAA